GLQDDGRRRRRGARRDGRGGREQPDPLAHHNLLGSLNWWVVESSVLYWPSGLTSKPKPRRSSRSFGSLAVGPAMVANHAFPGPSVCGSGGRTDVASTWRGSMVVAPRAIGPWNQIPGPCTSVVRGPCFTRPY